MGHNITKVKPLTSNKEGGFTEEDLTRLRVVYEALSRDTKAKGIPRVTLERAFGLQGRWPQRLFKVIFKQRDFVDWDAFLEGVRICYHPSDAHKTDLLFKVLDLLDAGTINKEDMIALLTQLGPRAAMTLGDHLTQSPSRSRSVHSADVSLNSFQSCPSRHSLTSHHSHQTHNPTASQTGHAVGQMNVRVRSSSNKRGSFHSNGSVSLSAHSQHAHTGSQSQHAQVHSARTSTSLTQADTTTSLPQPHPSTTRRIRQQGRSRRSGEGGRPLHHTPSSVPSTPGSSCHLPPRSPPHSPTPPPHSPSPTQPHSPSTSPSRSLQRSCHSPQSHSLSHHHSPASHRSQSPRISLYPQCSVSPHSRGSNRSPQSTHSSLSPGGVCFPPSPPLPRSLMSGSEDEEVIFGLHSLNNSGDEDDEDDDDCCFVPPPNFVGEGLIAEDQRTRDIDTMIAHSHGFVESLFTLFGNGTSLNSNQFASAVNKHPNMLAMFDTHVQGIAVGDELRPKSAPVHRVGVCGGEAHTTHSQINTKQGLLRICDNPSSTTRPISTTSTTLTSHPPPSHSTQPHSSQSHLTQRHSTTYDTPVVLSQSFSPSDNRQVGRSFSVVKATTLTSHNARNGTRSASITPLLDSGPTPSHPLITPPPSCGTRSLPDTPAYLYHDLLISGCRSSCSAEIGTPKLTLVTPTPITPVSDFDSLTPEIECYGPRDYGEESQTDFCDVCGGACGLSSFHSCDCHFDYGRGGSLMQDGPYTTRSMSVTSGSSTLISVIPDRLYWQSLHRDPQDTTTTHYISIDDSLVYEPFFADFGPLNLGMVYRYCKMMEEKLNDSALINKKIVHYCSHNPHKRPNAAFLICAFMVVVMDKTADEAYRPFHSIEQSFIPFRDATYGICTYQLSILNCLRGLEYGIRLGWFSYKTFDCDEYELHGRVENGDLNWIIPHRFAAFSGPSSCNVDEEGFAALTPEDYISLFKKLAIRLIIRLNKKQYDRQRFLDHNVNHLDLYFLDGSCPSREIINKFLDVTEREIAKGKSAVAVHCKAGLGRTGTLIGCYAIKHFRWLRLYASVHLLISAFYGFGVYSGFLLLRGSVGIVFVVPVVS
eukprot:GHVN01058144.1.p1 GENE.GHVN01058144.1~~GHVN01058144.1.p1  ORF type:complete len:1093 (-),score=252.81 GHVN01058144.1:982-4260(-)